MLWMLLGTAAAQRPILHSYEPIDPVEVLHGRTMSTAVGRWSASDGSAFVQLRSRRGQDLIVAASTVSLHEPAAGPVLLTRSEQVAELAGRWVDLDGETTTVELVGGRRVPAEEALSPLATVPSAALYRTPDRLGVAAPGGTITWLPAPLAEDYVAAETDGHIVLHSPGQDAWVILDSRTLAPLAWESDRIDAVARTVPLPDGKHHYVDVLTGEALSTTQAPLASGLAIIHDGAAAPLEAP